MSGKDAGKETLKKRAPQERFPFIVFGRQGKVEAVLETDEKGYRKSIEQGCVWHRDRSTGRLLPYLSGGKEAGCRGFKKREDWAEAYLSEAVPGTKDATPEKDGADSRPEFGLPGSVQGSSRQQSLRERAGAVLSSLSATVAERRKKMPEGSYTTHLFSSGSAKIRKKLGEEAVELILAGKKEDISYEAADLVYHMLVFLENESVSLDSVLEELEKRMG